MKTKSLIAAPAGTISVEEVSLVAESNSKATAFQSVPDLLTPGESTAVLETIEAQNELTLGGSVRLMIKGKSRIPRFVWDPIGATQKPTGPYDDLTVHTVVAVPKDIVRVLQSLATADIDAQRAIVGVLARLVVNNVTVLLNTAKVGVPAATVIEITSDVLATTSPLRRAMSGLSPLDAANGSYGSAT